MVMSFWSQKGCSVSETERKPLAGSAVFLFFLICGMFVELNLLWLDFPKVKK